MPTSTVIACNSHTTTFQASREPNNAIMLCITASMLQIPLAMLLRVCHEAVQQLFTPHSAHLNRRRWALCCCVCSTTPFAHNGLSWSAFPPLNLTFDLPLHPFHTTYLDALSLAQMF